MSEKPTNNIDDIFRNSIDNMETEPSEHFWLKASEDALYKSNLNNRQAVNRWKTIAAVLAIALVSLSAYMFYLQKQVNNLNGKVSAISASNSGSSSANNVNQTNAPVAPVTVQENNKSVASSNNTAPVTLHSKAAPAISTKSVNPTSQGYNRVALNNKQRKYHYNNTNPAVVQTQSAPLVNSQPESHPVNNTRNVVAQTVLQSSGNNLITSIDGSNDVSMPQLNTSTDVVQTTPIVTGPIADYVPPQKGSSRFSVSLLYEPYISDELLENESSDNVSIDNVISNEEEVNPYKIGARVAYNASLHFSFITGAYFYNFNVSVQPTTIFAQKMNDGDIGYSFNTSAGTVTCPYGNPNACVGDAMMVSGLYKANYITVPLLAKYSFSFGKWQVYALGGAEVSAIIYRKMNLHWEDLKWWNSGTDVEGISSSNNVYFSYYICPGVSYNMLNNLSLYAEPSLQGPPTLFSKTGQDKSGSIYTGLAFGLTYKF